MQRRTLSGCLAVVLVASAQSAIAQAQVEFDRDIRPILSDACFFCHGPDSAKRKAGLRLDVEALAKAPIKDRTPIVPGDPGASEIYRRLISNDPEEQMPPPDSHRSVTREQVELIRRWIEQGAEWQPHWAYVAPGRPPTPRVKDARWIRNSIDAFVLDRLEREKLKPSPEASRQTLIRRATLDLTGLPPTLAEIDAFISDVSPDAYERLIDRLLGSPRYGEHMAREWLDAARYADSNGYQLDQTRTMWPWRDWLVAALNANQPFDQFTIEMLAGDLIPGATRHQILASGFNRNHALNGEGGRIPEESRVEYVVDRVETTSTIWLGQTLGCARCHDHKYDPFSQQEFYELYAYFNNIDETGAVDAGGNANPVMPLPTPSQELRRGELNETIATLEAEINGTDQRLLASQAQWEGATLASLGSEAISQSWRVVRPSQTTSDNGTTFQVLEDESVLVGGPNPPNDNYTVSVPLDGAAVTGVRLEALTHRSLNKGGLARSNSGNFVLTTFEVEAVDAAGARRPVKLATAVATYSQSGLPVTDALDDKSTTGWAVYEGRDVDRDQAAVFIFEEPLAAGPGTLLTVRMKHESIYEKHNLGRFRLSLTSAAKPALNLLPHPVVAALAVPAEQRNEAQRKTLGDYYRSIDPRLIEARRQLGEARTALTQLEQAILKVMVMRERTAPRQTFILKRGAYDQYGETVGTGTPDALPPLPSSAGPGRLGLAQWIMDPANPLTARVTVNRYWQSFFGAGLVKTAEDFGAQGEKPSHRQLLDWLATEFVRSGWDVKHMHRLIATSATYRQSSNVSPELLERDPANRLLARGPRYRLTSFQLRDQALAISGLLVPVIGGEPVKPYQPPGLWEEFSFNFIKYVQDHGPSLYRRSLYTFWRRPLGPTMMFDTANRQVCVVKQVRTNTPLHSLILMNETGYAEAARVTAERLVADSSATDRQRVITAFRLATARPPDGIELAILEQSLDRLRRQYAAEPSGATEVLKIGEYPPRPGLDPVEVAAYTGLVTLILNLDETLTKE
jgi:hypothetical protein